MKVLKQLNCITNASDIKLKPIKELFYQSNPTVIPIEYFELNYYMEQHIDLEHKYFDLGQYCDTYLCERDNITRAHSQSNITFTNNTNTNTNTSTTNNNNNSLETPIMMKTSYKSENINNSKSKPNNILQKMEYYNYQKGCNELYWAPEGGRLSIANVDKTRKAGGELEFVDIV